MNASRKNVVHLVQEFLKANAGVEFSLEDVTEAVDRCEDHVKYALYTIEDSLFPYYEETTGERIVKDRKWKYKTPDAVIDANSKAQEARRLLGEIQKFLATSDDTLLLK